MSSIDQRKEQKEKGTNKQAIIMPRKKGLCDTPYSDVQKPNTTKETQQAQ